MYCPKCSTQNKDDSKFCRACGANLSLISQALTGELPKGPRNRNFDHGGPANFGNGLAKLFVGLGFIPVAFLAFFFAPAGKIWWFWMFLPAFAMIGKGIAEMVTAKQAAAKASHQIYPPSSVPTTTNHLPPSNPAELNAAPPSVTESTTKLFDGAERSN
jgi:hypothetical protein